MKDGEFKYLENVVLEDGMCNIKEVNRNTERMAL